MERSDSCHTLDVLFRDAEKVGEGVSRRSVGDAGRPGSDDTRTRLAPRARSPVVPRFRQPLLLIVPWLRDSEALQRRLPRELKNEVA